MISAALLQWIVIPALVLAGATPVLLIWLVWRDRRGGRLW